jgi:selenide, water dikinase
MFSPPPSLNIDDQLAVVVVAVVVSIVAVGVSFVAVFYPKHQQQSSRDAPKMTMGTKELVLVGGGHAHVYLLKQLGMAHYQEMLQKHRVTLIAKDIHTPYSGMLPGFISGHYDFDEMHIDLQKLCDWSGIRIIHGACTVIEYNTQKNGQGGGSIQVIDSTTGQQKMLRYDVLSLDVGSAPTADDTSILKHPRVIPVKPIADFCRYYKDLVQSFQQSPPTSERIICVVGGGAGGIELILSMQYKLLQILGEEKSHLLKMVLVTRGATLLEGHNNGVQHRFGRVLSERNIKVHFGCTVVGIETEKGNENRERFRLVLESNNKNDTRHPSIVFDDCLWCTNAGAPGWLSTCTPFPTNEGGFVEIDDTYQVRNFPGIFAAGDCCHNHTHPRPKAGVFAVRAGPPLLENIMTWITSSPGEPVQLKPHIPQSTFLGIISTGDKYAVASKGSWLALEGAWVWKWKDHIDTKWIKGYKELPER